MHAMTMPMRRLPRSPVVEFGDNILRGIGQVMLQNNPISGLLFLAGLFVSSWQAGVYALFGTAVATATARLLGAPAASVSSGLYGFNGALTGIGLATFLHHDLTLLAYVAIATMSVTVVTAAIQDSIGAKGYPLTGPFIVTTWIFIGGVYAFAGVLNAALDSPHLPKSPPSVHVPLGLGDIVTTVLKGVAQVMLQENVWTGALFLTGIAVGSRITAAAALIGSIVALALAWALGARPDLIRAGIYGFNAVLTAMALGGVFFLLHPRIIVVTAIAVCFSTILYGSLAAILRPMGLPALTAPFVITVWLCLLARASLPRLGELSPTAPGTPEENLRTTRPSASNQT